MGVFAGIELISGPLPVVLGIIAVPAGVFLLLRRGLRWWFRVAAAVLIAAGLTLAANWSIIHLWRIDAYNLPLQVLGWLALGIFAGLLTALNFRSSTRRRKLLALAAGGAVVLVAVLQGNAYFGYYRTIGDITGASTASITPLVPATGHPSAADPAPVAGHWAPPPNLPAHGTVHSAQIPGVRSGFDARTAYVYLPPAYDAPSHPLLPVLVLLPGEPGSPADWLNSGQLQQSMDAFAAAHQGLAPVVVLPDVNGSTFGNTMCLDSRIANADTYLSVDVPDWIKKTLRVDTDPQRWTIGGFSFGGTCSLQMAALHPSVFPSAIDLSGEAEPTLFANDRVTVDTAFGGDAAAYAAVAPLNVMTRMRYPDSWMYFSVGAQDRTFVGYTATVSAAARAAGMTVRVGSVRGVGHSWEVAAESLGPALDWLAPRLGLVP
jgi:S-formylglutathione hydrolase FrmB